MLGKAKLIFNGWKNLLIEDPVVEQVATKRADICGGCEGAKKGSVLVFLKDYTQSNIDGMYCENCPTQIKCPLSAKIRSINEKCPIGKW